ncbi:MAG: PhoH family protein [Treponemataceae bacterium]|nr:PhoH family protein [Treponemataceae bacterium]
MESTYTIVVSDSEILSKLCGTNDSNLRLIEQHLGVPVFACGNELTVADADSVLQRRFRQIVDRIAYEVSKGAEPGADMIHSILHDNYKNNFEPNQNGFSDFSRDDDFSDNSQTIDQALAEMQSNSCNFSDLYIQIPGGVRRIYPKTLGQAKLVQGMRSHDMVFAIGPAGCGKTFLAVAQALQLLLSRQKRKLVLTRPVVEAGESLGFLPGDLEQKINPYLRPLYDAMESLLPREILRRMDESGMIEIAPLAYMRGRTLDNCIVLLDEAQNTTVEQMKMFLTRMGDGSKVFITGDISQIDLPKRVRSGLVHAKNVLSNIEEICFLELDGEDVVRNPLVKKIIQAYEDAKEE